MGEAVSGNKGPIDDHLKRMWSARLLLKMGQCGAEPVISVFDLDQKPGFPIAHDQEVYLALLLVSQITQLAGGKIQIVPGIDCLQQVAGNERLGTLTEIVEMGPVTEVPLGLLAQRLGDIAKPGAKQEPEV